MQLECERFEFCSEVTAKAYRMGLQLVEFPIHYAPHSAAEGKKLRSTDGTQAFTTLWRHRRWNPRSQPKVQLILFGSSPESVGETSCEVDFLRNGRAKE